MPRIVAMLGLLLGCGPDDVGAPADPGPLAPRTDCDPLDPSVCAFPFPSSHFLAPADTETGVQVAFGPETLPITVDGARIRPDDWNRKDGFSPSTQLMTWFEDVALDGVIGHEDLGAYLDPDAKTVIVDAVTGERVPHFVERQFTDEAVGGVVFLRPVVRLEYDRAYVVGIRGLSRDDGDPVVVSEAFAALRDGTPTREADIEGRRAIFEATVFPALEAQGFPREDLQLAWDFHTASRASTLGTMEFLRDDALAALPPEGPPYVVDDVVDASCDAGALIGRTIYGRFTGPLYTEAEEPPTRLTRGEDGLPYVNGETEVPFIVRVPCSVLADPAPARLVQMGHGLLGWYEEVRDDYISTLAAENRWIVFSVPWRGMTADDRLPILEMIGEEPSDFAALPERCAQGMVDAMVAMRGVRGGLAEDPNLTVDGVRLISEEPPAYYGNSQGAILGAALTAMSPDLQRAALGVGGSPFSLLLDRSIDFTPFLVVLDLELADDREVALYVDGLAQQLWDPTEAAGWLYELRRDAAEPKEVLLHAAIGDAEVTTLGAHVMARAYGAQLVTPSTRPVWGLTERGPGLPGPALVEWRYTDVPEPPVGPVPPDKATSPHECTRRQPDAQAQIGVFLATGIVEHTCDGVCDAVQAEFCEGM